MHFRHGPQHRLTQPWNVMQWLYPVSDDYKEHYHSHISAEI